MKTTNLIISLLLIFVLGANTACKNSNSKNNKEPEITCSNPVSKHGQLCVDGIKLVDKNGEAIMLRGVSFGWSIWWAQFYNQDAVKTFAQDWNCNVVRAAMGVEHDNGYLQNPAFGEECVTTIVDAAIENGIYAIIDFHSHGIYLEQAKTFFTRMATKYKDYPNVIYEIYNEPLNTHTWSEVKAYSEELINTIRAIDQNNVILVGCPSWDQDLHLVAADPIVGQTNIMYTMHFYAATHKQWLRDRCDAAMKEGIPIFVSECASMEATGDGPIDHVEWTEFVNWMENNDISWVCWSVSAKDETCSMMTAQANFTGPWENDVLKEWGIMVKEAIGEKNEKY